MDRHSFISILIVYNMNENNIINNNNNNNNNVLRSLFYLNCTLSYIITTL